MYESIFSLGIPFNIDTTENFKSPEYSFSIIDIILTIVFPVLSSSSTKIILSISLITLSISFFTSFCSVAWLCSSEKNKYSTSAISSLVVCIYFALSKMATHAPVAVAVSANPITSSLSPLYSSSKVFARFEKSSRALEGDTGICFPCKGFTIR